MCHVQEPILLQNYFKKNNEAKMNIQLKQKFPIRSFITKHVLNTLRKTMSQTYLFLISDELSYAEPRKSVFNYPHLQNTFIRHGVLSGQS